MIVPFNPDNEEHIKAIVRLHKELLSESPIVQFGEAFMKKIYYQAFAKDRLFFCDLYYYENNYIGFITYTNDPQYFMKKGLRKHFMKLFFILLVSVARDLFLLKTVLNMCIDMAGRNSMDVHQKKEAFGEVLSFGVTKDSQKIKFPNSSKRVPHLLFEQAIQYFKNQGINKYRLRVLKDNKAALLFYLSYGGQIINRQYAMNESYQLEFLV